MVLKTFNVNAETYKAFSNYCKKEGISMSKKVEKFMKQELDKIMDSRKTTELVRENDEHPMGKYC